jgi:CHAD domain-containing protein
MALTPGAPKRDLRQRPGEIVPLHSAPPLPLVRREGPRKSRPERVRRDASAAEAFSANLARATDDIVWNGACALEGSDPEAIHQLRVATRRLRAVLSIYRKLLAEDARNALRDSVRTVSDPLGAARDADVFVGEILAPVLEQMPDDADLAALAEAAENERKARWDAARETIRSEAFGRLIETAHALASAPKPRSVEAGLALAAPAHKFAERWLRKRHGRLREAGRHLRRMDAPARHRLRIEAKKQRYAAELLGPLFRDRKSAATYAKALSRVQSALGAINDASAAARFLEGLRAKDGREELARGAAAVLGFHAGRSAAREEGLREAWKNFKSAKRFWKGG